MQCVHRLRNEHCQRAWGEDETRENRIIFIGRNMEQRRQELTEGFKACMAADEFLQVPAWSRASLCEKWISMNHHEMKGISEHLGKLLTKPTL